MLTQVYDTITRRIRRAFDAAISTPPVLEMEDYFPAHRQLMAQFPSIKSEAEALLARFTSIPRFHDISETQTDISANDGKDWRLVMLRSYGVDVAPNFPLLPATSGIVRAHPEILSATMSYLAPGKHIPPHFGPFRGVLRYHLCVARAPESEGECYLMLDGKRFDYSEGGALLWDDTYEHEVRNDTDGYRIALLIDIRRPDLPLHLRLLSALVIFSVATTVRLQAMRHMVIPPQTGEQAKS